MIQTLIDKVDTFEIVRDKVAQILAEESASQMALAVAAGRNPQEWKLRVFAERGNPWEQFLNDPNTTDTSPVVNVWFSDDNFPMGKGGVVSRQGAVGTINVDCIGFGTSAPDGSGGQYSGDEVAARESQRGLRLVRNILMASNYTYLDLRGIVAQRWTLSRTTFQMPAADQAVQKISGSRLALQVEYTEDAPQWQGQPLEVVAIDLVRSGTGQILAQLEYDYTT